MAATLSRGQSLWADLRQSLNDLRSASMADTSKRRLIRNVTAEGVCINGMTVNEVFSQATSILVESGQVYRWRDTLCYEIDDVQDPQLQLLATRAKAEPGATALLANLLCVSIDTENGSRESLPSSKLINALLADRGLWSYLPAIHYYSHRPIFDEHFTLCGAGWHDESKILIHGPEIQPTLPTADNTAAAKSFDRIPPFTRQLLQEFCWRSEADLHNALALLLTGLLINHFVDEPHPIAIVDGNQPSIGKTVLIQALVLQRRAR